MVSTVLDLAVDAGYRPLPSDASRLVAELNAPARLVAHLVLVHDVASRINKAISAIVVPLPFNPTVVEFGAATHDIGKALQPAELVHPGKRHEQVGRDCLVENGIPPSLARFAFTHGKDTASPDLKLEDLLVMLADKVWKAKRDQALEERVSRALASDANLDFWAVHVPLVDVLDRISEQATQRLAWQNQFPADAQR